MQEEMRVKINFKLNKQTRTKTKTWKSHYKRYREQKKKKHKNVFSTFLLIRKMQIRLQEYAIARLKGNVNKTTQQKQLEQQ